MPKRSNKKAKNHEFPQELAELENNDSEGTNKRARKDTSYPSPRPHEQVLNEPGPSMSPAQRSQQPQAGMSPDTGVQPASTTQPTSRTTTGAFPPVPNSQLPLAQPTDTPHELGSRAPADISRFPGASNPPPAHPSSGNSTISSPHASNSGYPSGDDSILRNPYSANNPGLNIEGLNRGLATDGDPLLVYFFMEINLFDYVSHHASGQGVVFIPPSADLGLFRGRVMELVDSGLFNIANRSGLLSGLERTIERVVVRWVSMGRESTENQLVTDEELARVLAAVARRGYRDEFHVFMVLAAATPNAQQSSFQTGGEASGNGKERARES